MASSSLMPDETKIQKAEQDKEKGTVAYKAKDLDSALRHYKEAANYVSSLRKYTPETQEMRKALL